MVRVEEKHEHKESVVAWNSLSTNVRLLNTWETINCFIRTYLVNNIQELTGVTLRLSLTLELTLSVRSQTLVELTFYNISEWKVVTTASCLEMCELRKNRRTEDEARTRRPGKAEGSIPLRVFVQKSLFKLSEAPYVTAWGAHSTGCYLLKSHAIWKTEK